jgi:hypothetical protein
MEERSIAEVRAILARISDPEVRALCLRLLVLAQASLRSRRTLH